MKTELPGSDSNKHDSGYRPRQLWNLIRLAKGKRSIDIDQLIWCHSCNKLVAFCEGTTKKNWQSKKTTRTKEIADLCKCRAFLMHWVEDEPPIKFNADSHAIPTKNIDVKDLHTEEVFSFTPEEWVEFVEKLCPPCWDAFYK